MYSSFYYKLNSRETLKGRYFPAFIGAAISLIPFYLLSLVETLFLNSGTHIFTITTITELLFTLFVSNIFTVGLIRFLMNMKKAPATDDESSGHYDYNLVLSGFTNNFANTFKTTLLMNIYLLVWGLLAFVPYFIVIGVCAYLAVSTEHLSEIFSLAEQLASSTSYDMLINLVDYISENCMYIPYMLIFASVASMLLTIPLIRKSYEYAVIPFIIAENPDTPSKDAFDMARTMMTGHKWRYFTLQLSFLGYSILISFIYSMTLSMPVYLIAQALLMPYMQMAYIHFYELRRKNQDNIAIHNPYSEGVAGEQPQTEESAAKEPHPEEATVEEPHTEEIAQKQTQAEDNSSEETTIES